MQNNSSAETLCDGAADAQIMKIEIHGGMFGVFVNTAQKEDTGWEC